MMAKLRAGEFLAVILGDDSGLDGLMAGMIAEMVAATLLAMSPGIPLDVFLATTAMAYMILDSLHDRGHGSWPSFGGDVWACWR